MKYFFFVVFFVPFIASAQKAPSKKIFVCTPCGYSCDAAEYNSSGSCSSCSMPFVEKSTVYFDNITFAEMCNRVKKNRNVLLLDVRTAGEFTGENKGITSFGHLKNAININVSDVQARLDELTEYKDKEIIVYCSHSHRSPRASYILTNNGFKNVTNVIGGVSILLDQFGNNECLSELFVKH